MGGSELGDARSLRSVFAGVRRTLLASGVFAGVIAPVKTANASMVGVGGRVGFRGAPRLIVWRRSRPPRAPGGVPAGWLAATLDCRVPASFLAARGSPLLWAAPNSAMRGRFEASLLATRATLLAFGALCWRPACLLALLRQSRRLTFLLCQAAALRAVWVAVLWSVSKCRYTTPRIWRFRQRRASRLVLPSVFFFS